MVTNCVVDGSSGGIVIGSESGSVRDVTVEDCRISGTTCEGLDIKSSAGRGGTVEDVTFRNVTLSKVHYGVRITTAYKVNNDGAAAPVPPTLRNIRAENITCTGKAFGAIQIAGLTNSPITNVSFKDCHFSADTGVTGDNASGIHFENVTVQNSTGPKFTVTSSKDVTGAEN